VLPSRNNAPGYAAGLLTAIAGIVGGILAFRSHRMNEKS
jgi:hypothetical protein